MKNFRIHRKKITGTLIVVFICVLCLGFERLGWFEVLELKSLDLRFRLRGPIKPHPDIVMVDISDDAIETFGQWPFPRHIHGLFIDAAANIGAARVIYDIYFSKSREPESDRFLGEMAARSGNVYFPLKFYPASTEAEELQSDPLADSLIAPFALRQRAAGYEKGVYRAAAMLDIPLPEITAGARGMGFINTRHDPDGVSRRTPAALVYHGKYYLQICIAALADYYQVKPEDITFHPGRELIFHNAREKGGVTDLRIPTDRNGNIIINWVGGWKDIKHLSYKDILVSYKMIMEGGEPAIPLEELQGLSDKILIIGHVERGSHDYYPIPFEKQFFLPGLNFNLLNTILEKNFIRQPGRLFDAGLALLLCFLFALAFYFTPQRLRILTFFLFFSAFLYATHTAFGQFNWWLPAVAPAAALALTFFSLTFYRYMGELKAKNQVKIAFQKYVTKDVMEQLLEHPERLKPHGEKKRLTIFFSDIRGFTSMSEKLEPEAVVSVLNEYLSVMTEIIFRHKGTIDKFVGDEIMAYFGAPLYPEDHARRAVHAAVEMKDKMVELQEKWRQEGKPEIRIGIGINTGHVVIGNIGSEHYMDFTLIGDNVNLGARLCSKAEAGEILLSESTYQEVSAHVEIVSSEKISVKGKEKPIQVYSVMNFIPDLEAERRRFKRREVRIKALIRTETMKTKYAEVVVDLSAGGFRMEGPLSLPKDTIVTMVIPLPNNIILEDVKAVILDSFKNSREMRESRATFVNLAPIARDEITKLVYLGDSKPIPE